MRKFLLGIAVLMVAGICKGQMLVPTVVASSGGYYFNQAANASLSVTVGEMTMVETFFANNHFLTQGFQQPDEKKEGIWVDESDFFELFEVFPNPASSQVNIRYQLKYPGELSLRFFNMNGVEVFNPFYLDYSGGLQTDMLDVSSLSQGMYFLQVEFHSSSTGIRDASFHKINIIR